MRAAWVALLVLACASRANDGRSRAADPAPRASVPAIDGGDDAEGCAADSDCALTRVPAGGCCPMLCVPRVVTRNRAEALEAAIPTCHKGRECPEPLCRPPQRDVVPACAQGRCVGKEVVPN